MQSQTQRRSPDGHKTYCSCLHFRRKLFLPGLGNKITESLNFVIFLLNKPKKARNFECQSLRWRILSKMRRPTHLFQMLLFSLSMLLSHCGRFHHQASHIFFINLRHSDHGRLFVQSRRHERLVFLGRRGLRRMACFGSQRKAQLARKSKRI